MTKLSAKEKMLNALRKNKGRDAFTTRQAKTRFGIESIRQRIHELRNDGLRIRTTTKVRSDGSKVTAYRLVA